MKPGLQLLVLVLIFGAFWLVIIAPSRRAQRRQVALQQDVAVGQRVIIASGIHGTIASVDGETVGLEVAPGVVITVARQAVVRRFDQTDPSTDAVDAPHDVDKTEE